MEMERDTSPLGTRGQWPVPREVVRWEAPLGTHTDPEGRTNTHSHQPAGRVRGSAGRDPSSGWNVPHEGRAGSWTSLRTLLCLGASTASAAPGPRRPNTAVSNGDRG